VATVFVRMPDGDPSEGHLTHTGVDPGGRVSEGDEIGRLAGSRRLWCPVDGVVVRWLVVEFDLVPAGTPLVEIDTGPPGRDARETALLGAILDAPEELAAYLVYADWLAEQPDEPSRKRGELIRRQCEDDAALALADEVYGTTYAGMELLLDRGFPLALFGSDLQFAMVAPHVLERVPLLDLSLHGNTPGMLEEIARLPGLAALRKLVLTGFSDGLRPLLSSPHLRGLRVLHLEDIGDPLLSEGISACPGPLEELVVKSCPAIYLRRKPPRILKLLHMPLGDRGAAALPLEGVEVLVLRSCSLQRPEELLAVPRPSLRKLDLSGNALEAQVLESLREVYGERLIVV
jgi:uncharacterized protein (TIGR02996 family)